MFKWPDHLRFMYRLTNSCQQISKEERERMYVNTNIQRKHL